MIDSSSSSDQTAPNHQIYMNSNDSNKWNEHYAAAASYYNNDINYYRNFQYQATQAPTSGSQTATAAAVSTNSFNHFHPPAYWLHHHAAAAAANSSNETPGSNSNWSPRSASSSANILSNVSAPNSYYQSLPISLNTANLTASSLSSSASSSTNNTPQSGILNSSQSKGELIANKSQTPLGIDNNSIHHVNYHSTPASSSFDPRMHSQLLSNAYQTYNFSNLHHYPHYNHSAANSYFYPATPPKDLSGCSESTKAKLATTSNSNDSSLNEHHHTSSSSSDGLSIKNEHSLVSPPNEMNATGMRSFKKLKLDADAIEDEKMLSNSKKILDMHNESEEDYDEDDENDEEEDDLEQNGSSLEARDDLGDDEETNRHFKHNNENNMNMWQMNPSGEPAMFEGYANSKDLGLSVDENNLKWSPNSAKNSKKKAALPGNYFSFLFTRICKKKKSVGEIFSDFCC